MKNADSNHGQIEALIIPSGNGNPSYSVRPDFIHLLSVICKQMYNYKHQASPLVHTNYGDFHTKTYANRGMVAGIYANDDHIILAFRGTQLRIKDKANEKNDGALAWFDIRRALKLRSWDSSVKAPLNGKISRVTMNTLQSTPDGSEQSFYEVARDTIKQMREQYPNAKVSITGHSLGGMLASAFAAQYIEEHPDTPIHGLYTFAQPRTGTVKFNKALERALNGPYLRVAIDKDSYTHSVASTVGEKIPSPLRWRNKKDESNDYKRVHGGTALIYYTDVKRFNNDAPNESYGYAERNDRPQVRILIPEKLLKDEKGAHLPLTSLRRHQIKTHRRAAHHIASQLTQSEISLYPRQKVSKNHCTELLPPPNHVDTAELCGLIDISISSEIGYRA